MRNSRDHSRAQDENDVKLFLALISIITLLGTSQPVFAAAPVGIWAAWSNLCDEMAKWVTPGAWHNGTGKRPFKKMFWSLFEGNKQKVYQAISPDYLNRIYDEWMILSDPAYSLAPLKYPIPEIAVTLLDLAAETEMTADMIRKFMTDPNLRESQRALLDWVAKMLDLPAYKNQEYLKSVLESFWHTQTIESKGIKYFSGIPQIPTPRTGTVRVYKGTNFYKGAVTSKSQAGKSADEVLSGEDFFLSQEEANQHSVRAEAFHMDGVSVSRDPTLITKYGAYVRIYDIPQNVFERLPTGAPELNEFVFKYSVPEKFRIMTLPKETYFEALKEQAKPRNLFAKKLQEIIQTEDGDAIVQFLKFNAENVKLPRNIIISLATLFSSDLDLQEGFSLERHTLMGYAQMKKLMPSFRWSDIQAPPNVDPKRTLQFLYSLHDSGKPYATSVGLSHQELSADILGQVMYQGGFTLAEIELAKALVGNDAIGSMIQYGTLTPQDAFEKILAISKRTNLSPRDFFKLQTFYYTVDASSYPQLLGSIFNRDGGMLVPKSDKFKVLKNLFENAPL